MNIRVWRIHYLLLSYIMVLFVSNIISLIASLYSWFQFNLFASPERMPIANYIPWTTNVKLTILTSYPTSSTSLLRIHQTDLLIHQKLANLTKLGKNITDPNHLIEVEIINKLTLKFNMASINIFIFLIV